MLDADGFFRGQALGNDYLVVETERLGFALGPRTVAALCDRHTGLGADGVIAVERILGVWGVDLAAEVVVHNADGSVAEVSGNGLRIAALGLGARKPGWRHIRLRSAGRDYEVRAGGGDDVLAIELPPARVGALREPLEVLGRTLAVTTVDIGNPHAVVEQSSLEPGSFPALASALECHERFPARTNVECLRVLEGGEIAIEIHERGVGPTEASGTGAAASAAAAVALGLVPGGRIDVVMRGGRARVDVAEDKLTLATPVLAIATGRLSPAFVAQLRGSRRGA